MITLSREYIGYHVIITVIRLCPDTFGGDLAFGRPNETDTTRKGVGTETDKRVLINKTLSTKSAYQEDLITEDASQQLVDSW